VRHRNAPVNLLYHFLLDLPPLRVNLTPLDAAVLSVMLPEWGRGHLEVLPALLLAKSCHLVHGHHAAARRNERVLSVFNGAGAMVVLLVQVLAL
jgi:hypothetical protein